MAATIQQLLVVLLYVVIDVNAGLIN